MQKEQEHPMGDYVKHKLQAQHVQANGRIKMRIVLLMFFVNHLAHIRLPKNITFALLWGRTVTAALRPAPPSLPLDWLLSFLACLTSNLNKSVDIFSTGKQI